MKLKESFMTSDTIDYFMGLPDGANYVVLYQMLCLKTINTEGRFERQIGAIVIPYDVEKIRRDTKWFSSDTIRVALNLYKQFGLIYEDVNGVLVIANHKDLVGSETDYASQKSIQRKKSQNHQLTAGDNSMGNVHTDVHSNVHIENREERLENRDKSLDTRDQILESNSFNDDSNDDDSAAVIDKFALNNGLVVEACELYSKQCDSKTRKKVSEITARLFKKAVGTVPTPMDEAKVYGYVSWPDYQITNDRIYIVTCAFYKAAEAGHRGQWNYIEAILDDMHDKGITTKEAAQVYYSSRKEDYE